MKKTTTRKKPTPSAILFETAFLKEKKRELYRQLDIVKMQLEVLERKLVFRPDDELITEAAERASLTFDWIRGGPSDPPSKEE